MRRAFIVQVCAEGTASLSGDKPWTKFVGEQTTDKGQSGGLSGDKPRIKLTPHHAG